MNERMADLAARWPFLQAERMSAVRKLARLHGSVGTGASLFVGVGFANSVSGVDGFVEGEVLLDGVGLGLEPVFVSGVSPGFAAEVVLESGGGVLLAVFVFDGVRGLVAAEVGLEVDFGEAGLAPVEPSPVGAAEGVAGDLTDGPRDAVVGDVFPDVVSSELVTSPPPTAVLSPDEPSFGGVCCLGVAAASTADCLPAVDGEGVLGTASTLFAAGTAVRVLNAGFAGALLSLSHALSQAATAMNAATRFDVGRRPVTVLIAAIKHRSAMARKT